MIVQTLAVHIWSTCILLYMGCSCAALQITVGKSLELEQPQYFVDGRGTLQAKKGR